MKAEQRCLVGTLGGAVIGALCAAVILRAEGGNPTGAALLVFAAVLLLNALLVGLRAPPLVRVSFTATQGIYVALAFILFGWSLLYGDGLPDALVGTLIGLGTLTMAYGLFLRRSRTSADV